MSLAVQIRSAARSATVPERWLYTGATVVLLGWVPAYLSWPFGWDQGLLAWVGDVVSRGGMPYRDAWDIKGPLAYYMFALARWLFGRNLWGIRVLDLILVISAAFALGRSTAQLTTPKFGRGAAVLFLLWYASGSYWHTAQPDGWVAMLMILAVASLDSLPPRLLPARLAFSGFVVGSCTLVKPIYAAFLLPFLLYVLWGGRPDQRQPVRACLLLLGGFALPLAVTTAWFIHRNAWTDLVEVHLRYSLTIYVQQGTGSAFSRILHILKYVVTDRFLVALSPAFVFGAVSMWRDKKKTAIFLLTWLAVALSAVALQGRYFQYHWIPMFPPVTMLAAVGFHAALTRTHHRGPLPARLENGFAGFALALIFVQAAVHPMAEIAHWAGYMAKQSTPEQYYAHFGVPAADIAAANYINSHTVSGDNVAVWGWNTTVIYLSGRDAPGRFGFVMPLLQAPGTSQCEAYQREFMSSLRKKPPLYIVEDPRSAALLGGQYRRERFVAFDDFLATRYRRETQVGDLVLYHLASDAVER